MMCRASSESSIDEDVDGMHVSRTMRVIGLMNTTRGYLWSGENVIDNGGGLIDGNVLFWDCLGVEAAFLRCCCKDAKYLSISLGNM